MSTPESLTWQIWFRSSAPLSLAFCTASGHGSSHCYLPPGTWVFVGEIVLIPEGPFSIINLSLGSH